MDKFMFREREIRRIEAALARKESILLVGIRRTGKTQLMKEIVRRHNDGDGFGKRGKAVYLDVSDYRSLHHFYNDLLANLPKPFLQRMTELLQPAKAIPNNVMDWLRRHIGKVSVPGYGGIDLRKPEEELDVTPYWDPIARAMLKSLEDSSVSGEIAFFAIDEFPFMVENLLKDKVSSEEINVALATLRKLRNSGIPMLLSGSISLENLLSLNNISHTVLGGLQRENLRPFSESEARSYLQELLGKHPAAAAIEVVLKRLPDYVPQFLEDSAYFLRGLPDANDAKDVDSAMEAEVLPAIRRSFNEQFQERLYKHYPGDELYCAEQLLDQLAKAPETGAPIDTSQLPSREHRQALIKLKYDMFIEEAPNHGYRFTLNILRLWWRNQRGMTE